MCWTSYEPTVYRLLDLEDEVHSIWVIWTRGFQEYKGNFIYRSRRNKQQFSVGIWKKNNKNKIVGPPEGAGLQAQTPIHLPLKVCTGMISVHPFALVQSNLHLSHVAKENFTFVTI